MKVGKGGRNPGERKELEVGRRKEAGEGDSEGESKSEGGEVSELS
jgi:hypothetical protein